jgi:hypothetical protein
VYGKAAACTAAGFGLSSLRTFIVGHMRLFPPIDTGDVTLVAVTGVHVDAAQRALQRSMAGLRFRQVKLIASAPPSRPDRRIEQIAIPPMTLADYNRFILYELHRHIDTGHVLIVQADGFVLNPRRWNPAWLSYDYIGAPWPPLRLKDGVLAPWPNRVGNGGFSLRSRRLLQLVAEHPGSHEHGRPEDVFICVDLLDRLRDQDIRFADPEEAARFSLEDPEHRFGQSPRTSFGFHGKFFLPHSRSWLKRMLHRA